MNIEISAVITTQLLSAALAAPAIAVSYFRRPADGHVAILVFLIVLFYGHFTYSDTLRAIYESSNFIQLIINALYNSYPELFSSWQQIAAWLSFSVASLTVWLFFFIRIQVTPTNNIVRGARLIPKNVFRSAIRRLGLPDSPLWFGDVPVPRNMESRPFLVCGEPGTGKTQIIIRMLISITKRREKFVCIDVGADIYKKLGRPDDIVLSPVHEEGIDTSPFADIRNASDCSLVAGAYIELGVGEAQAWNTYARSLLTVILEKCIEKQTTRNRDLIRLCAYASKAELHELVRGTTAQRVFDSSNEKKIDDILGIVAESVKPLELLNPDADHKSFSVRSWVADESAHQNLWIIFEDSTQTSSLPLRRAWITLIATEFLSLEPRDSQRAWIFLDELAANGKIADLGKAVSRLRKFGVGVVFAYQNVHQLYSVYGPDEAKSILGSVGHSAILRTPDPDTSEYLSKMIGDSEIKSRSQTVNDSGLSSCSIKNETQRLVLPSEINQLPDLNGYVKIAGVGWSNMTVPLMRLPDRIVLHPKVRAGRKSALSATNRILDHLAIDDI